MEIRRATPNDRVALGRLGALLMTMHYEFDRQRFLAPGGRAEEGYAEFLVSQLDDPDALVLVAERDGAVVGYCYAGIEPLSWKELRDEAGFIHDLIIDPGARGAGAGTALAGAAIAWLRGRGLPRVMLWAATGNAPALALFRKAGFRQTMAEMTLELTP
ncbi:MAG: GNAT family N-acetyltransferase [Acidobacteria bacterium]|nr:GNAT family N-acetyltransferase [Acidobacteriota bacterium]